MRATALFCGLLLVPGCFVDLTIPDTTQVSCTSDADCPEPYQCNLVTRLCFAPSVNQAPSVAVASVTPRRDEVVVVLTLGDANGAPFGDDRVTASVEYAVTDAPDDAATVWKPANASSTSDALTDVAVLTTPLTFRWDLLADAARPGSGLTLAAVDLDGDGTPESPAVGGTTAVALRFTPSDANGPSTGNPAVVQLAVGNTPAVASVSVPSGALAGAVPLAVVVSDPGADDVDLDLEFRLSPSEPWRSAAVLFGSLAGVSSSPAGANHVLVWDSRVPRNDPDPTAPQGIGATTAADVDLRVRAADTPATDVVRYYGPWSQVVRITALVNQTPPRLNALRVLRSPSAGGSGPVTVRYRVVDDESDDVDARFSYSFDGGRSFASCAEYPDLRSEGRFNLATAQETSAGDGGVWHSFVWDTSGVSLVPQSGAQLRVELADGNNPGIFAAETPVPGAIGPPGVAPHTAPYVSCSRAAASPSGIAVTDFDGDEALDVVTATGTAQLELFARTTTPDACGGALADPTPVALAGVATRVRAINLDHDDDVDFVTDGPSSLQVVLADSGTFGGASSLDVGDGLSDMDVVDLDGDGHADLLATTGVFTGAASTRQLVVFWGAGNGTFPTSTSVDVSPGSTLLQPRAFTVGDFDVDGDLDVAVARWTQAITVNDIVIVENTGGRVLTRQAVTSPATSAMLDIVAIDFDHDGALDLAVAGLAIGIVLLHNAGDAAAVPFAVAASVSTGATPRFLAVVDVNADANLDLAAGLAQSPFGAMVLLGQTSATGGGLTPMTLFTSSSVPLAMAILADDDIATPRFALTEASAVRIVSASDVAGFGAGSVARSIAATTAGEPREVVAADFDNDGILDAAAVDTGADALSLVWGVGANGIAEGGLTGGVAPITVGDQPRAVAAADLDGDGVTDIVVANTGAQISGEPETETLEVWRGGPVGSRTFTAGDVIQTGDQPIDIVTVDLDADGDRDLLVAHSGATCDVRVFANDGAAHFTDVGGYPISGCSAENVPATVVTADFNRDGATDFACSGSYAVEVTVYLNVPDGGGTPTTDFAAAPVAYPAGGLTGLATGDLNHDGLPDILGVRDFELVALLGQEDGADPDTLFDDAIVSAFSLNRGRTIDLFDADGDGRLDAVVSASLFTRFTLILGRGVGPIGDGTFGELVSGDGGVATYPPSVFGSGALSIADMDGDHLLDWVGVASTFNEAAIYRGQRELFHDHLTRTVEPWPDAAATGWMVGMPSPGLDRFGVPVEPRRIVQQLAVATFDGMPGVTSVLRAGAGPGVVLRPITAPWFIAGDARWTRMRNGRLVNEKRAGFEAGQIIVALPILDSVDDPALDTGVVRVFAETTTWRRADSLAGDPLFGDPAGASLLARVGGHDVFQPVPGVTEIDPDDNDDIATGTTPAFVIDRGNGNRRVLVRSPGLGTVQVFVER